MQGNIAMNPAAPDTLLLGVWSAAGRAAVVGSLRNWCGETMPDVLAAIGEPWTALVQALTDAARLDVSNVVILTNDADLCAALNPPFAPPAPTATKRIFYSRAEWVDVRYGGDADHWRALQLLGGQWGGRFRAMQVSDLPKARELWQSKQ
jgi:hypothetical protein